MNLITISLLSIHFPHSPRHIPRSQSRNLQSLAFSLAHGLNKETETSKSFRKLADNLVDEFAFPEAEEGCLKKITSQYSSCFLDIIIKLIELAVHFTLPFSQISLDC
jgi:hypothetical protein